jgi:hypothetical protein
MSTNSALIAVYKSIIKRMTTLLIFDLICFKFSRERCERFMRIFKVAGLSNIVNIFVKYDMFITAWSI